MALYWYGRGFGCGFDFGFGISFCLRVQTLEIFRDNAICILYCYYRSRVNSPNSLLTRRLYVSDVCLCKYLYNYRIIMYAHVRVCKLYCPVTWYSAVRSDRLCDLLGSQCGSYSSFLIIQFRSITLTPTTYKIWYIVYSLTIKFHLEMFYYIKWMGIFSIIFICQPANKLGVYVLSICAISWEQFEV